MFNVQEVNVAEQIESVRQMTTAEKKQLEADAEAKSLKQEESMAKLQAKADLLNRLGITEEEAKLLLS